MQGILGGNDDDDDINIMELLGDEEREQLERYDMVRLPRVQLDQHYMNAKMHMNGMMYNTTPNAQRQRTCCHGAPEPGTYERKLAVQLLDEYFAERAAQETDGAPDGVIYMIFGKQHGHLITEEVVQILYADAANHIMQYGPDSEPAKMVSRVANTFNEFYINDAHSFFQQDVSDSKLRKKQRAGKMSDVAPSWLLELGGKMRTQSTSERIKDVDRNLPCDCMKEVMKKYKQLNPVEMYECNHCNKKSHDMKQCTKCKMAQYCSKSCQNAAWPAHKLVCKLTCGETPSEAASKRATEAFRTQYGLICANCKKKNADVVVNNDDSENQTNNGSLKMKRCSRCQSVFYCSRDCQVAHWKSHKNECNNKSAPPVD